MKFSKAYFLISASVLLLAACSNTQPSASPPPPTASGSPGSPSPTVTMVGDCAIEPQTQCPGAQLTLVSIKGEDLHGANLAEANLHASDLRRVDFTAADLSRADLSDADLSGATLIGADLTGARLKHANLTSADLTGAQVRIAQLNSARLCDTKMPDGSKNDTSCEVPSPSPSPVPTASTSPTPSTPTIVNFYAPPSVTCSTTDTAVDFNVHWATKNADSVTILYDGGTGDGAEGLTAKGSTTLSFACDVASHKLTLVASGGGKDIKATAIVNRA